MVGAGREREDGDQVSARHAHKNHCAKTLAVFSYAWPHTLFRSLVHTAAQRNCCCAVAQMHLFGCNPPSQLRQPARRCEGSGSDGLKPSEIPLQHEGGQCPCRSYMRAQLPREARDANREEGRPCRQTQRCLSFVKRRSQPLEGGVANKRSDNSS